MAHLSLRDAERRFKVTRPTLSKALKSGKISGTRNDKGHWEVDTAELARVYKVRESLPDKGTGDFATRHAPETVNEHNALQDELEALRTDLAVAKALADERGRLLDAMVKQITDETKPAASKRRKWWPVW